MLHLVLNGCYGRASEDRMMPAAVDAILMMPLTPNQGLRNPMETYSADSISLSHSNRLDEGFMSGKVPLVSAQTTSEFTEISSARLCIRWHQLSIVIVATRVYSCLTRTQVFSEYAMSSLSQGGPHGNGKSVVIAPKCQVGAALLCGKCASGTY